jgi:hypothetical protein
LCHQYRIRKYIKRPRKERKHLIALSLSLGVGSARFMTIQLRSVQYLLSRIRWMPRLALAVNLALFVAAGLAHAAHVHKEDTRQNGAHTAHCGLCIQFDRVTAPPATSRLPLQSTNFVLVPITRSTLPVAQFRALSYDARGPPLTV